MYRTVEGLTRSTNQLLNQYVCVSLKIFGHESPSPGVALPRRESIAPRVGQASRLPVLALYADSRRSLSFS